MIAPEALRDNAEQINSAAEAIPQTVEHDLLCPAVGQILSAEVRELEDGHLGLYMIAEVYEAPVPTRMPDGAPGFWVGSQLDHRPIATARFRQREGEPRLWIDATNLGGYERALAFLAELEEPIDEESAPLLERRSAVPDPILLMELGCKAAAVWAGWLIGRSATKPVESAVEAAFERFYKAAARACAEMLPLTRPVTHVMNIGGDPDVQLVARTRDQHQVVAAFTRDRIADLLPLIETARDRFDAVFVQFLLAEDGDWRLHAHITSSGVTVGSVEAFERRAVHLRRLEASAVEHDGNGGSGGGTP